MKILSISLGRRGGFPVYGREMTQALSKIADVSFIVASGSENIADWEKISCPHLKIETYHDSKSALLSLIDFKRFNKIKQFISACNPDVVYYPGNHYWKPIIDHCIAPHIPIVMTTHDPLPHPGEDSWTNRFFSFIETRKPDGYILLNDDQKTDYIKRNRLDSQSVTVIPHGIFSSYLESLKKLDDFEEFRDLIPHRKRYFLFIGRIVKYKGIATLLKAAQTVMKTTQISLVIAGGGNLSEEEKNLLSALPPKQVFFFNHWLSESEVATLTNNAFMTLLPYEGATQSGVIPLSFAFGTPAIASDSGGLKEQIIHGKTGFLFQTGNVDKLSQTMREAQNLTNEEYKTMRSDCLSYAKNHWDWNILAKHLLGFFERIILMK